MSTRRVSIVQQRQHALREHYRSAPADAWINDGAQTENACGGDPFHGVVVPANGTDAPVQFGIHRAVGGCLRVEGAVPVGFQRMRCSVRLQTVDHVDDDTITMLLAAAEHSCVVMQTLRSGIAVQVETSDATAAITS